MNKQKITDKSEHYFCLPKHGRKKKQKQQKLMLDTKETNEISTETAKIQKYDILTIANLEVNSNVPKSVFQKRIRNFPLCQDVKGIDFDIDRPSTIRNDEYRKSLENPIKSMSKLDVVLMNSKSEKFSSTPSITLKDILDQSDSSMETSTTIFGSHLTDKLEFMPNTPNLSIHTIANSPIQSLHNQENEKFLNLDKNENLSVSERKWNKNNFKVYDYFETTTLLPIGQGVMSLTPTKSGSQYSPTKTELHHLKASSKNFSTEISLESNKFSPSFLEKNDTSIEIPPHMPPLLSLKKNGYSSFHSAKLPFRPRKISETFENKRSSPFERKYITDENDYQDIDNILFQNNDVVSNECQRPPYTHINNILENKSHLKKCSSNENNSFAHLPTKLSDSHSSLMNLKSISYNTKPVEYNTNSKTATLHYQISTGF